MKNSEWSKAWRTSTVFYCLAVGLCLAAPVALSGCGSTKKKAKQDEFFTSGSKEADQRASQRMAKSEQLSGSGEGAGEKGSKKSSGNETNKVEGKTTLFERLGGEAGVSNIVADFLPRVLQDPRVNWERTSVKKGGWFQRSSEGPMWKATPQNVAALRTHLIQFIALATGGPAKYDGKEMKSTHAAMKITNPEFDAAVGDLKASLDKLQIGNKEQKELLAIIESTRPQVVTQR